jgi:hypothetical protein
VQAGPVTPGTRIACWCFATVSDKVAGLVPCGPVERCFTESGHVKGLSSEPGVRVESRPTGPGISVKGRSPEADHDPPDGHAVATTSHLLRPALAPPPPPARRSTPARAASLAPTADKSTSRTAASTQPNGPARPAANTMSADDQPAVELPVQTDPVEEFMHPRLITHETKRLSTPHRAARTGQRRGGCRVRHQQVKPPSEVPGRRGVS